MSDEVDIATCNDEELLTKLLGKEDKMDKRRQIRARLKEVRDEAKRLMEERRKAREQVGSVDAVRSRAQMAEEEKARKLKAYQEQAKAAAQGGPKTDAVKAMAERAAEDKAERMKQFDEMAKTGGPVAFQGGLDSVKKMEQEHAEREKQRALQQFSNMQKNMNAIAQDEKPIPKVQNKGGQVGVSYGTRAGQKPAGKSPMNAFKAMDKAANPEGAKKPNFMANPRPARGGVTRNPSAIKQMLLEWCKAQVTEYENVNITNFGSSWADGLAFCALIHHFYPDAFDYSSLSPKKRRENFQLAFDTAEKMADICPLLDVEDMVMMKVPDWKCVFTQIQSYYRTLRNHERNALKAQEARANEE